MSGLSADRGLKSWQEIADRLGFESPTVICTDFMAALTRDRPRVEYVAHLGVFLAFESPDLVVIRPSLQGWLKYIQDMGFGRNVVVLDSREPLLSQQEDWAGLPDSSLVANYPPASRSRSLTDWRIQRLADSKASLRETGSQAGVPLLAGGVATSQDELLRLINRIGYPIYIKRDGGHGGDYVALVSSAAQLPAAMDSMMASSSPDAEEVTFIVEEDARRLDESPIDFNVSAVVGRHSELVLGYSRQLMGPRVAGFRQWWGSSSWFPDEDQLQAIESALTLLVSYWRELGYVGAVGPDGFLLHSRKGWEVRWFDANARFPGSFYPWMIANALGHQHWYNINVTMPMPIADFSQVQSTGLDSEGIVWMASRSTPSVPHSAMKVFLGGETWEDVEKLLALLQSRGVEIGVKAS